MGIDQPNTPGIDDPMVQEAIEDTSEQTEIPENLRASLEAAFGDDSARIIAMSHEELNNYYENLSQKGEETAAKFLHSGSMANKAAWKIYSEQMPDSTEAVLYNQLAVLGKLLENKTSATHERSVKSSTGLFLTQ